MECNRFMDLSRFHDFKEAVKQREKCRRNGERVVLTNGCFDLMHPGHVYLLQQAAAFGDRLWIALNSDRSVKSLKGPMRPILSENLRAYELSALRFVDGVFLFDGSQVQSEIRQFRPDVYVRAADRTLADLNSKELCALREVGAAIEFVGFLPDFSTTKLIERLRNCR